MASVLEARSRKCGCGFPIGEATHHRVLSNNKITVLRNASFFGLQALEKLDLKNNLISTLEHDVFMGLAELKRLDLSNNRIGCLTAAVFRGLVSLTRLNLSGNIFSSLMPGTFDELPSLKQVDFATDYLTCDCNLRWVVSWSKNSSALISDRTLCVYPGLLHDQPLRGLKERHLTCMGTPELHTHQLIPSLRQVVFQGDRLPFECSASYLDNSTQIQWYHNSEPVEEDDETGIILEDSIIHDCTIISSELILSNIDSSANGEWECTVFNTHGNVSKKVEIVVLETSASYCPAEKAINNRGEFRWPRTVAGITVYQPCLQYPFPSVNANGGTQDKRALRRCDRSGSWEEGDYSKCLYTNDITRVLYTFVLMPINASNALTLAHQLRVYTAEAANFSDMMDVIYVAQMIAKFIGYVDQIKQLGEVIVEMASNIMLVDGHILWMAQEEDKACTSIVQSVEKIAGLTLSSNSQDLSLHSRNIALEAFLIKPESYVGLSCTAFQRRDGRSHRHELQEGTRKEQATEQHPDQKLKFRCTTGRSNSSMENLRIKHSVSLASIQLPETLFSTPASSSMPEECKLQFVVFRNGKFFHSTGNSSGLADNGKRRSVSTPVIYAGIHGCSGGNLSDPVMVSLRHLVEGGDPVAAYWNFDLLEGNGGWSSNGCQLAREEVNITTIHCWHMNNFAVLKELNNFPNVTHCAAELPHSVIYTCTAILLLCLFATIITYIVNHSTIHISRKGWHMVLNLCFHIAMTSAVFAGGITLSNYLSICQVVGIVLHYSTLATLLWMGVKARVIYKDMNRKPHLPQEGEVPQPAHRPMLRFYLIAGGIPLIICGITAAVNINNPRENHSYCLVWQPSLAAFYAPAAVILLVTWIYFLCTGIALKRRPAEQKEPLEHGESLTRLGGGTGSNPLSDSGSLSASPASQNLDVDSVHSLKVQFWALLITHCLYIALWGFGALAVSQSWYYSVMFSCLYGVVAVALGLFVFIHHCVRRPDVIAACCPSYRHTLPMQGYVHPGIIVDDTSQVFMGCSPEVANSVKSSSSLCSSNHSTPGHCKLTNLQVVQNQAEICPQKPACYEEPQPVINKNSTIPSRYTNNLHGRRNHKSRTKQYREGKHHRLKVLRGPSSDQPSSESGSLQNSHTESYQSSRNSPLNNGSTGGATRDPDGTLTPSEGSDTSGQQPLNAQATDGSPGRSSSRDNLKQANSMERDSKRRSYPVNMGSQNGTLKGSKYDMNLTSADSSNGMKTGLWKSETTV